MIRISPWIILFYVVPLQYTTSLVAQTHQSAGGCLWLEPGWRWIGQRRGLGEFAAWGRFAGIASPSARRCADGTMSQVESANVLLTCQILSWWSGRIGKNRLRNRCSSHSDAMTWFGSGYVAESLTPVRLEPGQTRWCTAFEIAKHG